MVRIKIIKICFWVYGTRLSDGLTSTLEQSNRNRENRGKYYTQQLEVHTTQTRYYCCGARSEHRIIVILDKGLDHFKTEFTPDLHPAWGAFIYNSNIENKLILTLLQKTGLLRGPIRTEEQSSGNKYV